MDDDLEEDIIDELDEDEGFDEFSSQKPNIADTIRKSPALKMGIVAGAIIVVFIIFNLFGNEQVDVQQSSLAEGSEITSTPGATDENVAPAYIQGVQMQNEQVLEDSLRTGQSAIPVPVETTETRLQVPEVQQESQQDPLQRWRVLQEERIERELQAREEDVAPVTVLSAEEEERAIDDLANVMVKQMETVLQSKETTNNFVTKTYWQEQIESDGTTESSARSSSNRSSPAPDTNNFQEEIQKEVVVSAGKIFYAQLLLQANSDVPNTVMAQIMSGPLKGWKALGQFEVMDDIDMLAITFDKVVNDDGEQYSVEAVMLDPATSLPAMATDVNHRLFRRIVFPAAAAFLEGYAQALSETGQTVLVVDGTSQVAEEEPETEQEVGLGIEEGAAEIAEFLDEEGDVPTRIIIDAGTAIGIFFTENVEKEVTEL